ncbi:restriction endonuclease subunit S [Paraburkholderia terrae]
MKLVDGFQLLATVPDGIAPLRKLILMLAVMGKLAQQDSNDEPAGVLLQKISAKKNRLIAEGKLKRDKTLSAITEGDKPFDLPAQWEWVRAQDICTAITDGDHQPPPKATEGVPFLVIGDVRCGSLDLASASRFVPKEYFDRLDWSKKPVAGDILYTTVGSFGIPVPVTGEMRFCFQRHIGLFRPAQTALHSFLNLVLASDLIFQQASARATGIAQKTVPLSALRDFKIPLPPLAEQSRIVAKVDELMHLCDELETHGQLEAEQHARLTATLFDALAASESSHALEENWARVAAHFDLLLDRPEAVDALEQTILQLAVRGLLVQQDATDEPASALLQEIQAQKKRLIAEGKAKRTESQAPVSDEEKSYELPLGWEWHRLDEVAVVGTGTTPSRDIREYYSPPTVNWVTSGETGKPFIESTAQHVSELALRETSLKVYPVHTLVIAMYGQGKTRGQISELLVPAATNQACAGIVLINDEAYHRKYVKLFFEKIYDEIREQAAGGAQPNLNVGKVKSTLIPIPPLSEQARIVDRVEELRCLCADLRARLTARRTCQARFAETLVGQVVSFGGSAEETIGVAAAA